MNGGIIIINQRYKDTSMVITKNNNMRISSTNGKIRLVYTHKLVKKVVKRKNKSETINTFYSSYMPPEIVDYFNIRDSIFFYRKNDEVLITSRRPSVEHQEIKIQKSNQFSIPTSFFKNVGSYDTVSLVLDLSVTDDYKSGLGVLVIRLL